MLALLVLVLILLIIYSPSFDFKLRIGNKEIELITSEVSTSESSE